MKRKLFQFLGLLGFVLTACTNSNRMTVEVVAEGDFLDKREFIVREINLFNQETKNLDTITVSGKSFSVELEATNAPSGFFVIVPNNFSGDVAPIMLVRQAGKVQVSFANPQEYKVQGQEVNEEYNAINKNTLPAFVGKYIAYPIGEQLFLVMGEEFGAEQAEQILKQARPEFVQSEQVQAILERLSVRQAEKYVDVELDDLKATKVKLSDYVGKSEYLLVDFWASWCPPCIAEIPHIASAYAKYKDKGFHVVSISVDEQESDWKSAIATHNMPWVQLRDVSGNAATTYGVTSIPYTLLLDKEGKIVGRDFRGGDLENKLQELLGKK